METVGFIGLGNMGGAIAANIGAAGYPLIVNDIQEEANPPSPGIGCPLRLYTCGSSRGVGRDRDVASQPEGSGVGCSGRRWAHGGHRRREGLR